MFSISVINILQKICSYYANKYGVTLNNVKAHIYHSEPPCENGGTDIMIMIDGKDKELTTNKLIREIAVKEIKKIPLFGEKLSSKVDNVDFIGSLGDILQHYATQYKTGVSSIEGMIINDNHPEKGWRTIPRIYKNKEHVLSLTDKIINDIIKL